MTVKEITGGETEKAAREEQIRELKERTGMTLEELILSEKFEGVARVTVHQYLKEQQTADERHESFRLGPGDRIHVDFFEAPEMSKEYTVLPDGSISLPLVGKVLVTDLSTDEVAKRLEELMTSRQLLTNPGVNVVLVEIGSKNVKLFGAVGKAGRYPLKAGMRLLDLVAEAGGVDFTKDNTKIYVLRRVSPVSKLAIEVNLNELMRGKDPPANLPLRDEDIIFIPLARRYMVIGEVKTPGVYTMDSYRKTGILEALIQSGGFTPIAAKNKVWIYRVKEGKAFEIQVRVGDLMKGGKRETVYIEEDDMIIVPESLF